MILDVRAVREPPLHHVKLCFNSCRSGVTPPLRHAVLGSVGEKWDLFTILFWGRMNFPEGK